MRLRVATLFTGAVYLPVGIAIHASSRQSGVPESRPRASLIGSPGEGQRREQVALLPIQLGRWPASQGVLGAFSSEELPAPSAKPDLVDSRGTASLPPAQAPRMQTALGRFKISLVISLMRLSSDFEIMGI